MVHVSIIDSRIGNNQLIDHCIKGNSKYCNRCPIENDQCAYSLAHWLT